MKRAPALALAALTLAACTSPSTDRRASNQSTDATATTAATSTVTLPPEPSPTTEAAPEPTDDRNARGNREMALKEEGTVTAADGSELMVLAVDNIRVDPKCNSGFSDPPENGHFIALDLRVSTGPAHEELEYISLSSQDFDYIGPAGVTVTAVDTATSSYCLADDELFPYNFFRPSSQYRGALVLDVPGATGTVVYYPPNSEGGFEWKF